MVNEALGAIAVSKTVTEILEEIEKEICDNYCKYPDVCMAEKKDVNQAEDMLYDTYCVKCPFNKI